MTAIAPDGDKVVHSAGDPAAIAPILKAGGAFACSLGAMADQLGRQDVSVATIMAGATAEKLAALLERVAKGEIRVTSRPPSRWSAPPRRSLPSPTAPSARS